LQLLQELQRRNVFRVAIGYVVSSWLLVQVADLVLENIGSPDWVMQTIMLLLALGFPVVVFFSWAYEVTPEGLKRESEVDRSQSITHVTGRKLDRAIVAVLVIALAYFAFDKFVLGPRRDAELVQGMQQAVSDQARAESKVTAESDASIAVLPFVNMSSDAEQEYFSDGLSEELLNLLAKIPELRVIGRTSSFQFKGKNEDLRVIGEKLGVANILEGSVRKSGDTIRVTAQLISAADGAHLWSDTFDRNLDDIFKVQDEIAGSVVETLKLKLLGRAVVQRNTPKNSEAYDLYLRGHYFYVRLADTQLEKAKNYFEQALALDPELALAWSGMSAVYIGQTLGGELPVDLGRGLAVEALEKALAIDPMLAGAHYRLGFIRLLFDWDWPGAEDAFRQTLVIEPNSAEALSGLGLLSMALNRPEDAIDFQQQSLKMDPLRAASHHNLGFVNYQQDRYEAAEAAFRTAREIAGGSYTRSNYYVALSLLGEGKIEAARSEIANETGEQWRLAGTATIAHALDREAESEAALLQLVENFSGTAAIAIAQAYAYRGDSDSALQWLEKAYEQHDPLIPWITGNPLLKSLHGDTRFDDFVARLNLRLTQSD
jgi:adenylate cyclase